jgi:phosphoglycerol transferase MdoB-like AlkP superfamily enzyme
MSLTMNFIKKIWDKIPLGIRLILKLYAVSMAAFTIFRILFIIIGWKNMGGAPAMSILESFKNGLMYDTSASGYLLAIPFVFSLLSDVFNVKNKAFEKAYFILTLILFCFGAFVCLTDIPYFLYFNTRVTSAALNWFATPKIVLGFIAESYEYYIYGVLIFAVWYLYYRIIRKIFRTWTAQSENYQKPQSWKLKYSLFFLVFAVVQFAGIRGKVLTRRPLSWGEAFSTTYPFVNYAGLNPVFTLGSSYFAKDKSNPVNIVVMDEKQALANMRSYYGIKDAGYDSPMARECKFDSTHKRNVIVVVMESMGTCYLGETGFFKPSVTPFLDSLSKSGIYFNNFYADGIHTYNGMWSVFTSLNSPPSESNAMVSIDNAQTYSGIGSTLYNNGYETFFGCPHDANFDNMGGVMSMNGFKKVLSAGEFLNKEYVNVWGTSDHYLFKNSLPDIKRMGRSGKPFLAALLTISNHGPYHLPDPLPAGFHPKYSTPHERAVEYADWSIKNFIDSVKSEPWFDNTIFVFVADHGKNLRPNYEMNYYTKHIPMIFWSPKIISKPQVVSNFGSQVDLFPTLMELLGINYVNNTLGVNLFREKRQYAAFSAHSILGAVNDSLLMLRRGEGKVQLLKYKNNFDTKDYSSQYPQVAKEMEKYVLSHIQTSLWLVKSKKGHYIPIKK